MGFSCRAAASPGQLAALAPPAGRPPAGPRPWRAALTILPGPGNTDPAFPAVPDVEFPLFRAAARRLLDPAAFAYVDAIYLDTYARAGACAGLLRGRGTAARAGDRTVLGAWLPLPWRGHAGPARSWSSTGR